MLFNSLEFMLFLPIAFAGYWLLSRHLRLQNLFIVVVSYVFYGWWDWRFLILIAFTSLWSFVFGLFELNALPRSLASKMRLALSCAINLGILGYFKYCDFFVSQAVSILRCLGVDTHVNSLTRPSTFALTANFFRAETSRDIAPWRTFTRLSSRNDV